ncbi:MAG: nuclear transport factor 2 family protein, partial [Thermoanaerobaculia bacterium]|nr:nuclear transport factor 2 family protein [Thermoanaerobaculia bacterium]
MKRTTKRLIFGTGVASLAAIVLTTACSNRSIDLVSEGKDALRRTEDEARDAMARHSDEIDESLERFRKLFDEFRPGTVSDHARALYAPSAYFNDGFVELTDSEEIASYFDRSAEHTAEIDIIVEEMTRTVDGIYVRWIMSFTTTGGTSITAPGISHLRFNTEGQIIYHRDYWDAGSALAELVPVTGAVLRAIKARL